MPDTVVYVNRYVYVPIHQLCVEIAETASMEYDFTKYVL